MKTATKDTQVCYCGECFERFPPPFAAARLRDHYANHHPTSVRIVDLGTPKKEQR